MEMNSAAIWINNTFAAFDQSAVVFIHKLYEFAGGFFTPFFEFISELGHDGIPLIILALILMLFRKTRKYGTVMLISLAIGALITNCCLKILIARARPYSDETKAFFNTDLYQRLWLTVGQNVESDKSFPSGHTTAAFASMTALFLSGNRKISWTAYIFAFLMAVARIYLVVHFASDVLAGIIVGLTAGILGYLISLKLPSKYYNSNWPFPQLSLYYKDLGRKYYVPYKYIDRAFCRISECQPDDSPAYYYYRLILVHEQKEFANLIFNKEEDVDYLLEQLKLINPDIQIGYTPPADGKNHPRFS